MDAMDKDILHLIENVDELIPRPTELLQDEVLICECFCVSVGDIRTVCDTKLDLDLLTDQLNFGSGCQSCVKDLNSWKDKIF